MSPAWPRAGSGTGLVGHVKRQAEDFRVEEILGFEPDGDGEHLLVHVEKRDLDTSEVASLISRHLRLPRRAVTWAGRKDRHAVARQWFGVHWRRPDVPDLAGLHGPKLSVLDARRHRRKLRPGALAGNRFRIRIANVEGPRAPAEERLRGLAEHGAPNYFGPQRFGRDGGNVEAARAALAGNPPRLRRERRYLLVSAARSWLFNLVLARRVRDGTWNRILPGELLLLEGSNSFFRAEPDDGALAGRLAAFDVSPSGPLCGEGAAAPEGEAARIEAEALADEADLAASLAAAGMRAARRSLRLRPSALEWSWEDSDLLLSFELPAGAFATSLLAELLDGTQGGGAV